MSVENGDAGVPLLILYLCLLLIRRTLWLRGEIKSAWKKRDTLIGDMTCSKRHTWDININIINITMCLLHCGSKLRELSASAIASLTTWSSRTMFSADARSSYMPWFSDCTCLATSIMLDRPLQPSLHPRPYLSFCEASVGKFCIYLKCVDDNVPGSCEVDNHRNNKYFPWSSSHHQSYNWYLHHSLYHECVLEMVFVYIPISVWFSFYFLRRLSCT